MANVRKITKYIEGTMTKDGAGVSLNRIFGYYNLNDFDPFLLLDFFDSTNPKDYEKGFPWHPHRGIETVTYIIEGKVEHEDSIGNKGVIADGDCQWMTAGSGIMHQEMPKESPKMLGVQLWINLPKKDKMTKPKYRDINKNMVEEYKDNDMTVKVIAGKYKNIVGPIEGIEAKPIFFDVTLAPNVEFNYELTKDLNVFALVIEGSCSFEAVPEKMIGVGSGVLFGQGDSIKASTKDEKGRFLFIAGKPLKEPVAWGGPIVMNTKEELNLAFSELEEGTFIK